MQRSQKSPKTSRFTLQLSGDSDGLKVTNYPILATHAAQRILTSIGKVEVLEVCCGIGGTTIELAKVFPKVYAVDINPERIKATRQNLNHLHLEHKVDLLLKDIFDPKLTMYLRRKKIQAVHTDVEWTTTGIYGQDHASNIQDTSPDTQKLFNFLNENYSENICMRLPKTVNQEQLKSLGKCEIEEVVKNGDLKCLYGYFGKLANRSSSKFSFT